MAQHKLGYITASIAKRFLTGSKSKPENLLVGNLTACKEIALERLELDGHALPDPDDAFVGDKHTERGNRLESANIEEAQRRLGKQIHSHQHMFEHNIERWSCTVDGLVGDNAIYEAKAPTRKNQVDYILNKGSLYKEYKDQIQFQLMLSGREYVYIGAFCPLFLNDNRLFIETVEVDKEWRDFAQVRLAKCEEEIQHIYDELLNA